MNPNVASLSISGLILFPLLVLFWKKHGFFSLQTIPVFYVFIFLILSPISMTIREIDLMDCTKEAMVFLGITWGLWLIPLYFIKKPDDIRVDFYISEKGFRSMMTFTILTTCIASLLLIQTLPNIFANNIDLIRTQEEKTVYFYQSIAIQLCSFFPFTFFFLLLGFAHFKISYSQAFLLVVGSICEPLHVLLFYGRDGFVQWIIIAILSISLFYCFFENQKQKVRYTFACLTVFCFIFLFFNVLISASRTKANQESYTSSFITLTVDYFVQIPRNFVAVYDMNNTYASKTPAIRILPFLRYFDKTYDATTMQLVEQEHDRVFFNTYGYDCHVFSSFLGELVGQMGRKKTFLISFLFCILLSSIFLFFRKSIGYYYFALLYSFSLMINFFYLKFALGIQGWIMLLIGFLFLLYSNWFLKAPDALPPRSRESSPRRQSSIAPQ